MEFLVFLFVISNLNLVLTNDNLARERTLTHQHTYKVHPEPEDVSQTDQLAESSHSISEAYKVMNPNQIQISDQKLVGADVRQENVQQVAQERAPLQENLRQNNDQELQSAITQGFVQPQQIYLQHYPIQAIQVLGAEASPLHQTYENDHKTLGYSSYIEHTSQKDEEEIKSALKEGSVNDIKRLVPKSGISFKIYQNNKNFNNQKTEFQTTHLPSKAPESYSHNSKLQYRIKTGTPVTQFKIQTAYQENQQPVTGLEVQDTYSGKGQQGYENSQQSVSDVSQPQDQHGVIGQAHYFTQQPFLIDQSDINSQKAALEVSNQNSFLINPHFKVNEEDPNYSKATTEFNSPGENRGSKYIFSDISNVQYQKQWKFDSTSEDTQKVVKNAKPPPAVQQDRVHTVHTERTRPLHYTQNHGLDIQNHIEKHKTPKSYSETPKSNVNTNHFSNSYAAKTNQNGFVEHLADKAYLDKETAQSVINRFLGNHLNTENVQRQNHVIGHLGTNAYANTQPLKDVQGDRFSANLYPDSETAKSTQHNLISHIGKNSFVEAKASSQNNFDHQKALEGSTSFDIKNAIDSTGSFIHHTNYGNPTDVHSIDDIHKQQFAYILPKIPTSTASIDNSIHDASVGEEHQIKGFGQTILTSPHVSYQSVSSPEVNGKFFHQPQTIVWTSEHLKQGNALTANDFHQSLIRLHLPKQEIYQHVKSPSVELPTSSISHISYPHQKQPYVLHYDVPLVKYPQEVHFQPKGKTRIQNGQVNHIKLAQPLTIDWSLFKSTLPNFNINSLAVKPELTSHLQETGKKIVPILVRKRKNRSNNKQEIGVVYGKVNSNRRPTKPMHRQEKNVRVNLHPEATNNVKQFEANGERKNEFSVSAFYKVDRSLKSPNDS